MTTAATRPPAPPETPAPAPTPTARPPTPVPMPAPAGPDAGIANLFPAQVKLRLPNAVIAAGPGRLHRIVH